VLIAKTKYGIYKNCAHNPPSPALLEACDRLGMMVIDETFDMWDEGKYPADYQWAFLLKRNMCP
jgi:beta-galactosidase/beta-glucuronidase